MSITKEELLRQLEEIERAEADEDAAQSLEKPKGKVIRVVQATKRTKNPKQQERTPAQKEATRKMLEARKKKLDEKREISTPKEDEVLMVIEPPKKPRKPYTRKPKPKEELKPPQLKRSTNRAVVERDPVPSVAHRRVSVISDDESVNVLTEPDSEEEYEEEEYEEELPPKTRSAKGGRRSYEGTPRTAEGTPRYNSNDRRFR